MPLVLSHHSVCSPVDFTLSPRALPARSGGLVVESNNERNRTSASTEAIGVPKENPAQTMGSAIQAGISAPAPSGNWQLR
jgi:hypothetical protein